MCPPSEQLLPTTETVQFKGTCEGERGLDAVVVAAASWAGLVTAGDGDDARLERADDIAKQVSELRGLEIKTAIERGVMTKAEIRARLEARLDEQYSADEIRGEAMALERFGMLGTNADLRTLLVDLLTEQVAGFYDPKENKLYVAGWGKKDNEAGAVMAHEIDHALQDQHFDLESLLTVGKAKRKLTGDETAARQALVEGDGMALMVEYSTSGLGMEPWANDAVLDMMLPMMQAQTARGSMASAPLVLREGLGFPYVAGLKFIAEFRKNHTWARIDEIYAKLPLSTEHILHVDSYIVYEVPDTIADATPAVLADAGYARVYRDVVGEHGLSVLLRQHGIRPAKADDAAAGWGGDRIAVYAPADHDGRAVAGTVGVIYSVWDDEADALELFDAMADAIGSLANGGKAVTNDADLLVRELDKSTVVSVERKADTVVIIVGAPTDTAKELRKQIAAGWKVTRAK